MTQNNHCSLCITISEEYKLQVKVIDEQDKDHFIKINEHQQEEYLPITIAFDMNEIIVCQERDDSIQFMKEWIEHPTQHKEYSITYQKKGYTVISELLFALIINEFKKKIKKEFIIDETIVHVPSNDYRLINRIRISLESIGLKEITINPIENYSSYSEQGEYLQEILEKQREYEKYKRLLERSQNEVDNTEPMNEEKYNAIARQFTFEERTKMQMTQLDNYCIFIASKYLDTIEDHINLIHVCKRLKLNMTKFHFNPLPLTKETREFFPNLRTLFVYSSEDELFEDDERIIARKDIHLENYLTKEEMKQLEEWTNKKCLEVIFDSNVDDWSQDTSVFNLKVMNKSDLIFLIEDTNGNKFGEYIHSDIHRWETEIYDSDAFLFSLKSNGRINGMMKFEEINGSELWIYNKSSDYLFYVSCGLYIYKEHKKNQSSVYENTNNFDFHGTTKALHPNLIDKNSYAENFIPKRFVVIQMNEI